MNLNVPEPIKPNYLGNNSKNWWGILKSMMLTINQKHNIDMIVCHEPNEDDTDE